MQTLLLRTPQISKKRGLDMAAKKAMKKPKSNDPKLRFTVNHALTTIYVTLLFTLFPLFLSNYYYAVRRDKFALFAVLTCIAGVAVGAVALATFINRNNEYNKKLNTYHDPFKLSITDIGIFAFAAVSIYMGVKGGELAWSNGIWRDVNHFVMVQKMWTVWGIVFFAVSMLYCLALSIICRFL